jgi:uncharacterized protein involved in outer membrane biogenesis
MKRVFIAFVSLVLVLGVALVVGPNFLDWNQYKAQVVELAKKQAGLDVELKGDLKIAIFPSPYAYVNDVSVQSPAGSQKYETLAQLERLDLNLELMPLLSGNIVLSSVNLVNPQISLEILADGTQSWQTPEIKNLMAQKNEGAPTDAVQDSSAFPNLVLNNVQIDGGKIALFDHKSQKETIVDDLNVILSADSLAGPFLVRGGFGFEGRRFNFDAKTGRLSADNDVIPLDLSAQIDPDNVRIQYSGVVAKSGALDLQGNAQVTLADVSAFLNNNNGFVQKNEATIAGTLSLKNGSFSLNDMASKIGESDIQGSIKGQISPLEIDVDLKAPDLAMKSISDLPALAQITSASIKGKIKNDNKGFGIDGAQIALNDSKINGDIFYTPASNSKRARLDVDIKAPQLDFDLLTPPEQRGGSRNSSGLADVKKSVSEFSLPLDVAFKVDIDAGRYAPYSFKGLKAEGEIGENALSLTSFSVASFADAAIIANGKIGDIKNISGLDLRLSAKSQNFKALADLLKIDSSGLPKDLGSADVAIQIEGEAKAMAVTANIKALNGEIIAAGTVSDPLGALEISALTLQIKHRNMNEAMRILSSRSGQYDTLNKPMDVFAVVDKSNDGYVLKDIKADMAGISVEGQLSLDLDGTRPFMRGDLKMGDINIQSAGNSNKAGNSSAASAPAGSRWSREALNNAWMTSFDYELSIAAKSLNYEGWALSNPVMKSNLSNGLLNLESLAGGLYQGTINLAGTLKPAGNAGGYTIDGDAKLSRVSLEPLVEALAGNQIIQGRGLVDLETSVRASGISPAALVYSLKGQGTTNGETFVLEGFDLVRFGNALSDETKPGDTVSGIWKGATKGGTTEFDTMVGSFTINEGVVNISKLDLDGPRVFLNTKGNVDLPRFYISTEHMVTLKGENIPPPFPIKISGPLDNPTQTFTQGVLDDYISRKINRKLEGFLSDKLGLPGQKQQPAPAQPVQPVSSPEQNGAIQPEPQPAPEPIPVPQQQQEIKPEEAIKGLLKGLLQ